MLLQKAREDRHLLLQGLHAFRLLLQAPESAVRLPPQPIAAQGWSTLATEQRLPLLVLLAMAEEQKPLEASLLSLQHLWRRAAC